MAAGRSDQVSESSESDENKEYDPRLDFFSDQFDPLLALRTPGLKVPDIKAKRYDNLAIYASSMSKEKLQKQNAEKKTQVAVAGTSNVQRRWLPHQMPIQSTTVRNINSVLTRMAAMKGPLALLRKCKDERLKIKVWTRHDRGIRGYCVGYVVAFDKHWNLALEDVTEFWTRPKKKKVPAFDAAPSAKRERSRAKPPAIIITAHNTSKKLENCTREVQQLMMRGEHIVMIQIVKEDDSDDNIETQCDISKSESKSAKKEDVAS